MNKSILVIDTPDTCIDCPCYFAGIGGHAWCEKKKKKLDIETFKPDWCPLREFPKKASVGIGICVGNNTECVKSFVDGYNACIDEILKGADRDE